MGWGFIDRATAAASGLGGAAGAALGLVKDLATAEFDPTDPGKFFTEVYKSTQTRLSQFGGELFGPQEGIGAVLGAVPEHIRSPARNVLRPVNNALEEAYSEGVSQPLSTLFTAAQLADSPEFQRHQKGKNTWDRLVELTSESYNIAEGRSPGQALALGIGDVDLWDDEEVAKFVGTDFYEVVSGTSDALTRLLVDPTVVGGKAVAAFRVSRFGPSWALGTSANSINQAMKSRRVNTFIEKLDGMDAATIRDRFFPDHAHGAEVSYLLAEAPDAASKSQTLRAIMGDAESLDLIRSERADIANQLERLTSNKLAMDDWQGTLFAADNTPESLQKISDELKHLGVEDDFFSRIEAATAGKYITQVPRVGALGEVRAAITSSNFYQKNPLAKPVASIFNMRPNGLLNLEESASDVELSRFLTKSRLSVDDQTALRSRYLQAPNAGARMQVALEAEHSAIRSILAPTGMTLEEINKHIEATTPPRRLANNHLNQRIYDGTGRSRMQLDGADGLTDMPLLASQTANLYQLPDINRLRDAADRIGTWRGRYRETWGTRPTPSDLMETFYKAWKPLTLLRPAWPMRVLSDEQLRLAAKLGAAEFIPMTGRTLNTQARTILRRHPKETTVDPLTGANIPKAVAKSEPFKVMGYDIEPAFGSPGDIANRYAVGSSSRGAMLRIANTEEATKLRELREAGVWGSISPNQADAALQESYWSSWTRAVNHQIGTDPLAQVFLRGGTQQDALNFLNSAEGLAYQRRIPFRKNHEAWVADVEGQINAYLPNPELRGKALAGTASFDDLNRLVDPSEHPTVHGELLAQSLGGGSVIGDYLNTTVDRLYTKMAAQPTDALSRHPYFDATYRAEMEMRVKALQSQLPEGGLIDDATIRQMETASRTQALHDVRDLLYDITAESDLSHALRFVMPFFSAWQEVITRWSGMAIADPSIAARARLIYNAPSRAGMLYDGDGNLVNPDGSATDPFGNKVDAAQGRYIRITLPEAVNDWPGMRRDVSINAQSLNMIANGPPGFGPLAQIPVNELVKDNPDLEGHMKFILPFGPSSSTRLLLPTVVQRAMAARADESDEDFVAMKIRLFQDEMVNYNLGSRDEPPTYEEVSSKARALASVALFAKASTPFSYNFNSPYQFYIDAYRNLLNADPQTADETFINEFGEEYFALTTSITKSVNGVPVTVEGDEAFQKYQDLIQKYPEFGRAIIGEEGAGEFSRAVYQNQLNTPLVPGGDEPQRRRLTLDEATQSPNIKLGWMKYSKFMDLLDAQLDERGLPNYNVAPARDLRLYKQYMIEEVFAKNYPEWFEEFRTTSSTKWPNRIKALREIAADERLAGRPEFQGVARYLELRDEVSQVLTQRKDEGGAGTLTAVSNQDVNAYFQTSVQALIRNLAFSDFYYRYLENDPVEAA